MPPRFRDLISSPTFWKFSKKKRKFKMTSSSRMCKSRDWKRDEEYRFRHGGDGKGVIALYPPRKISKNLLIKMHQNHKRDSQPPGHFVQKPLTHLPMDFGKNFRYPFPWIFNRMHLWSRDNERKIEDASLCLYCNPSLTRRFFFLNPKLPIQDNTSFGV